MGSRVYCKEMYILDLCRFFKKYILIPCICFLLLHSLCLHFTNQCPIMSLCVGFLRCFEGGKKLKTTTFLFGLAGAFVSTQFMISISCYSHLMYFVLSLVSFFGQFFFTIAYILVHDFCHCFMWFTHI